MRNEYHHMGNKWGRKKYFHDPSKFIIRNNITGNSNF